MLVFEKTCATAIRTACLYGMMTLIPPNFHICATYPPNNFYSTNQARHRESFSLFCRHFHLPRSEKNQNQLRGRSSRGGGAPVENSPYVFSVPFSEEVERRLVVGGIRESVRRRLSLILRADSLRLHWKFFAYPRR